MITWLFMVQFPYPWNCLTPTANYGCNFSGLTDRPAGREYEDLAVSWIETEGILALRDMPVIQVILECKAMRKLSFKAACKPQKPTNDAMSYTNPWYDYHPNIYWRVGLQDLCYFVIL